MSSLPAKLYGTIGAEDHEGELLKRLLPFHILLIGSAHHEKAVFKPRLFTLFGDEARTSGGINRQARRIQCIQQSQVRFLVEFGRFETPRIPRCQQCGKTSVVFGQQWANTFIAPRSSRLYGEKRFAGTLPVILRPDLKASLLEVRQAKIGRGQARQARDPAPMMSAHEYEVWCQFHR